MFRITIVFFSLFLPGIAQAQDALLPILQHEMQRQKQAFSLIDEPPYYLEFRVSDFRAFQVSASLGTLVDVQDERSRVLSADVRVGSYALDHTHQIAGAQMNSSHLANAVLLPVDNDTLAISQKLWLTTDGLYQAALRRYKQIMNSEEVKATKNGEQADFSREPVETYAEAPLDSSLLRLDWDYWKALCKELSAQFKQDPNILYGMADFGLTLERRYFVSSEGSQVVQNFSQARVMLTAQVIADDGSLVPLHLGFDAFTPEALPGREALLTHAQAMVQKLTALKKAPLAEPYSGPALFSPRVAGVFFTKYLAIASKAIASKTKMMDKHLEIRRASGFCPSFYTYMPTLRSAAIKDKTSGELMCMMTKGCAPGRARGEKWHFEHLLDVAQPFAWLRAQQRTRARSSQVQTRQPTVESHCGDGKDQHRCSHEENAD
ncbi:MAG: hypothetical protein HC842_08960 [Cytophagales bacterium]|nr:hypothetical protein [Cytophagales bacterium]